MSKGAIWEYDFKSEDIRGQKVVKLKESAWWLSVRALFILADTWFSCILLDKDNSVDRVTKVNLVLSVWRDKITS